MTIVQRSIEYFDQQFRQQVREQRFELNPFERAALPHLRGEVLDFGCGLGNLAQAAARRGCRVLALDASPTAIAHLNSCALGEGLCIRAEQADLSTYRIGADFDAVVSIGLLMFFDCPTAFAQLEQLKAHVAPGGVCIVNVLTEGTTWRELLDGEQHCLFAPEALRQAFAGWEILDEAHQHFPAPGDTDKAFATVIARRAAVPLH